MDENNTKFDIETHCDEDEVWYIRVKIINGDYTKFEQTVFMDTEQKAKEIHQMFMNGMRAFIPSLIIDSRIIKD